MPRPLDRHRPPHWVSVAALYALGLLALGCTASSRRAFFASCGVSEDCQSGLCWQGICSAACATSEACGAQGVCVESHCKPRPVTNAADTVASGDATPQADTDSGASSDATAAPGSKTVFLTSAAYTAGLGGLAGADANCQALAVAAQRSGVFKAWLSDTAASPATRFSAACKSGGPFVLVDGTVVAQDWAELTSGKLQHAIQVTEKGATLTTGKACASGATLGAWTGTLEDGTPDKLHLTGACAAWTTSAMTFSGQMVWGNPAATKGWSADSACSLFGATICSRSASLYCFEQ